jgi:hypothetical protein
VGPHTHVRAEGYRHTSLVRAGEGILDLHTDGHRHEKDRERRRVLLEGSAGMSVQTLSRRHLNVASDGTLELSADDAEPFIRNGWRKLGECIIDPDPCDLQMVP